MPKSPTSEQEDFPATNDTRDALIGRQVIRSLGSPKDLLRVHVRPVGSDRYRVNVITGKDYASGRIAESFFLTADEKGNIVSSSPEILKRY